MHIAFLPEFWRLLGVTGMTKVIGFMILVVCPNVVLTVCATITVVVWVTAIFFYVVDHFSVHNAAAGNLIPAVIANELIIVFNTLLGNYD